LASLFDGSAAEAPAAAERVVRVLPDVPAIDKTFDYLVPDALGDQVRVGTVVRVELHGRRVGGWVVADPVTPPQGVRLRPIAKVTGWGPSAELIELAEWAAWRWAGRQASLLSTATADHAVPGLPRTGAPRLGHVPMTAVPDELIDVALATERSVVRLPPAADRYPVALAAAARGGALILAPSVGQARTIGGRLRRAGVDVAIMPREWAAARAGARVVVGSRAAAWAPVEQLRTIVVFDEHDEVYQEERAPTWHARDVAIERARRAGATCVLVSPVPTLEAQAWAPVVAPSRSAERQGWPIVDVVDRRDEDPARAGLYSPRLVAALRDADRAVCILNRKGRSRLLVCATCGETARCESCEAAVAMADDGQLVCGRCGTTRPKVCQGCGGTTLKNLRVGVTRAREELEALTNAPVLEVSSDREALDARTHDEQRLFVGTEAALHQVHHASLVAFLDFDQELLAPRYRAAEQALALLVRASRIVGGRRDGGRLLIQTRQPQHEVIAAALHADPALASDAERVRREFLRFPPVTALAAVSGASAPAFIENFGHPPGVEVLGPSDGQWLLRAADHELLCGALGRTPRPAGRLRVEVDPLRV
jgi:primosomal protein N' (replication factor Y)